MDLVFTFPLIEGGDNLGASDEEITREEKMLMKYCKTNLSSIHYSIQPTPTTIPVGNIKWCEMVYGVIIPDYYPFFLSKYLYRNVWVTSYQIISERVIPTFIRPAAQYHKWSSHIYDYRVTSDIPEQERVICSDVVNFLDEWRYYFVKGELLDSAWYKGNLNINKSIKTLNKPSPNLPTCLSELLQKRRYTGVLDMGTLVVDGKMVLALVKAVHSHAARWYPRIMSYENYAKFLIGSDKYLKSKYKSGSKSKAFKAVR